ncbi:MAG: hypothetical protein KDD32_01710 [Bacteroidetes bacterium]|nr:hypothetical protein [Bacteroidota bacterium]
MLNTLIQKVRNNEFEDVKGSLKCKIPFTIPVINALLNKAEDNKGVIKQLEVIRIDGEEITLKIALGGSMIAKKIVDRELKLKIHPNLNPPEWLLYIEVLDGINTWENEIIELLFNTKLKNKTVDFENRNMVINHKELFENDIYQHLIKSLVAANLETESDKIYYDLTFKFD